MPKKKENPKGDIFQLLLKSSEKKEKSKRAQLLESLNVKEFFEEGTISINKRTCQGLECELCIKTCPTKALYWQDGKVGIIEDLCVYCGACVLCCIVDDCIKITRKRPDGKVESFSKPWEIILLYKSINSQKRHSRVESLFPDAETYLKRYRKL
jgi:Fe-S-cluster-containing hydrogenase component 2